MKRSSRRRLWWLFPLLLALPVIAGILLVWSRYGETVSDLLIAGIKLAVKP